ncbi:MAG: phytanoyl-CoA dioxygenase family protein [Chitinophagaceae bacterium]|nr:phytanoyl-CoA dioxygenase family protein [Chitinophagaceae bacterium]
MIEQHKIDEWLETGYTVFPDAVPPELLARLRDLFEQEMSHPEDDEGMGVNTLEGKDYVSALANLCRKGNLSCLELLGSPFILELAESICGPDFFLLQEFAVIKILGDNLEVLWHLDVPNQRTGRCFTMGIYLDDADPGDGALRMVPGSHKSDRDICELRNEPSVEVPVKAGGILIHDMMLAHSSGLMTKNPIRRVLYFEFMSAQQALRENLYDREQLSNRMRLIQLAITHYRQLHPDEPFYNWSNPFQIEPDSGKALPESLRELYQVKTFGKPSAYCFEHMHPTAPAKKTI